MGLIIKIMGSNLKLTVFRWFLASDRYFNQFLKSMRILTAFSCNYRVTTQSPRQRFFVRRPLKVLLIVPLSSITIMGCGTYVEQKAQLQKQAPNRTTLVDFQIVQKEIFSAHCVRCHGQYQTYAGVRRELESIQLAINGDRMPKRSGPLSGDLKKLLQDWVGKGAPEFAGQVSEPIQPIPLAANWESIYTNIITPRCLVCHNPRGEAKFLDLSSRQIIFDQRNRVFNPDDEKKLLDFDRPEESYILEVIQDEFEPMPPLDSNLEQLTASEVEVLTEWIGLGLP